MAAEYAAERARKRRQLLPELIRRYRKGENLGKVAADLGLKKRSDIDHMISQARKRGEWPAELRRRRHATKNI